MKPISVNQAQKALRRSPQPLMPSRRSQRILSFKERGNPVIPLKAQPLNDRIKIEIIRFRFHYNWKVAVSRDGYGFIRSLANHLKVKLPEYPISADTILKWTQRGHSWIVSEHTKPKGTALYQRVIDELVREEAASGDGERRMECDGVEDKDEHFKDMNRRLAQIESGMSLMMKGLKVLLNSEHGQSRVPAIRPTSRLNEQPESNGTPNRSQLSDDDVIVTFDGTQPRTSRNSSSNIRRNSEGSVPGSSHTPSQTVTSAYRREVKISLQIESQVLTGAAVYKNRLTTQTSPHQSLLQSFQREV